MLRNRLITQLCSIRNRNFTKSSVILSEKQNVPSFKELSDREKAKLEQDKSKLIWRTSPHDQPYAFKSRLNAFGSEEVEPSSLSMIVQPVDFSPSGIKKWWKDYKVRKERFLQQYIPERHEILGNDLAAAHFLLYRKGKVRFVGQNDFVDFNPDEDRQIPIPNKYNPHFELEAIKCDGMELYYEGLENLRRLKKLVFLSFKDVKTLDDWCLDRVSGSEYEKLQVLDISGTSVTANGLQALYRIPTLKKLIVTHPQHDDPKWNLTLAMLQEIMPDLEIISSNKI